MGGSWGAVLLLGAVLQAGADDEIGEANPFSDGLELEPFVQVGGEVEGGLYVSARIRHAIILAP